MYSSGSGRVPTCTLGSKSAKGLRFTTARLRFRGVAAVADVVARLRFGGIVVDMVK